MRLDRLWFRFPFDADAGEDQIWEAIKCDEVRYHPASIKEKLDVFWKNRGQDILTPLISLARDKGVNTADEYRCIITFYGSHGFFVLPDAVFINVASGKSFEFFCETMLHELLHVIFADFLKDFSYVETERWVDSTFIKLWGNIFPQYLKQDFS